MSIWSFSRLNCYNTCPYLYYLNYIDDDRVDEEENAFSQYGSYIHKILEKYFNSDLELFELADYYRDHYEENVLKEFPKMFKTDLSNRYYNDGLEYFNTFDGFSGYDVLGVEQSFTVPLFDNEELYGFIDLILKDKNGDITIIDHKSKSKFSSKKEKHEYSLQPALYSLYCKEKFNKYPKTLAFNHFRTGKITEIPFSKDLLDEALMWSKETISMINSADDFLPRWSLEKRNKNSYFCYNLCGHRDSCPYKNKYVDEDGNFKEREINDGE